MKKIVKNNMKIVIAFVLGIIIAGTSVYAANALFASSDVGYSNVNTGLKDSNGNNVTDVQTAIDELYKLAPKKCTTSPFKLGDYVEMTPTATSYTTNTTYTGYTSTQTINPSELNLWRVININDDCTVEVVSEYVSTTSVYFKGKTGYINYVGYLQELAKQYANTTYTLDPNDSEIPDGAFRIVGYNGQTKIITDTTKINDSTLGSRTDGQGWNHSLSLVTDETLGGGDSGYVRDMYLLNNAGVKDIAYKKGTTTKSNYWLASRLYYWNNASNWSFYARLVYSSGSVGVTNLAYWSNGSMSEYGSSYALRPIVTLKSGLTPTGSGTASSHYILN